MRIAALAVLMLAGGVRLAGAHGVGASYLTISLAPGRTEVAFLLSAEELARHFPQADASRFLAEHVRLSADGDTVPLQPAHAEPHANGAYVRFAAVWALRGSPSAVGISADRGFFERLGSQHVMLVDIDIEGHRHESSITADRPVATIRTGYRPLPAQSAAFLALGVRHIFLGYDHVLFLVAVVLIGGSFGQLVRIVTAFTAAHTVTLALAAFQIVTLPSHVVEGGIALSLAYVAFDNLFASEAGHRWILTFAFGLVHGFGFAGALADMNLPRSTLVPTVLSFNIGVEAGQVAVLTVLFPAVLWLSKQSFRRGVVVAASVAIFVVGVGWFVQRAFPSAVGLW